MRGNKYGTKDRREYKRLWAREHRAIIYAARTQPVRRGPKPKGKGEARSETDQTGA